MTDYLDVSYSIKKKPLTNYPKKLAKYICDNYYNKKRGSLLDVGCGRGDQLLAFEKLGFKCVGVDNSQRSKDFLKDKFVKVNVFKEKFPFEDESFDFIFCKSVIEHVPLEAQAHFFSECYRVIKKEGTAVFMTIDWETNYKIFFTEYTHIYPFAISSLEQCLKIYNFSNIHVERFVQLPIVWDFPSLKILTWLVRLLKLPKINKFLKYSRELMLLGVGKK